MVLVERHDNLHSKLRRKLYGENGLAAEKYLSKINKQGHQPNKLDRNSLLAEHDQERIISLIFSFTREKSLPFPVVTLLSPETEGQRQRLVPRSGPDHVSRV